MKRNLLWALLSWLSLLSFGAQAQTNVTLAQENFEDGTSGASPRYGYTTVVPFTPTSTRFFERKLVTNNSYTGLLGTATGATINGTEGTYLWAARSVRSSSSSNINSNAAAVLQLNDIAATNYSSLRIVVAFADPSGTSRNTVVNAQRIRLQYSFDGSPWVTAGLIMGNSEQTGNSGYYQQDASVPLDSIPDGIVLNQTFQDITAAIGGTGTTLRVRIVADTRLPQFVFDNVRVIGNFSASPKPTLANLESTAANYTEGGNAVQLTSALTVGYSDNSATNLTGGTVTIGNLVSGDMLNYTNQLGISGVYNTGTGVLTLSGTTTQANYQTALRSITYSNTNATTLNSGTRQVTFQVYNGSTALSNTPVRTINVTGVLNSPAALPYTENFNSDGEGLRYFGNSFASTAATAGFFRATTGPATSGGSPIGNINFTGWSGGYWFGENTKLNGVPTRTIQLAPVNAAGAAGLKFVIAVGSSSTQGSSASWNSGGYFKLYYRANGGSWTEFGSFTPDANGVLHRGGSADSAAIGPALRYVTFPLPTAAAVSNLDFQLTQLSDGDEELAFDNIRISAATAPTVATGTAGSITTTTAAISSNSLGSDGGASLTDYGVVYVAGTGTPTTSNTKVQAGTSSPTTFPASFSVSLSGLTAGTQYTARAYATNSVGTSYGDNVTFTTVANPTVTSVTRLTPSPTATTSVSYLVVFSGSVLGLTTSNFSLTTSGLSGAAVSTLSGSNTTYTVTVNTGSGNGTLTLNVANATGVTPTISNVPYTSGEQYTITKSFAAAPTLRIQAGGSASGNGDVTAFVDAVQVLNASTGTAVAGALQNASFETNNVQSSNYLYQSQGVVAAPWSFGTQAGISRNNSAFGSTAADGDAVAFLQSTGGNNGNVAQSLAVPTGSYQIRFRALQRNYTSLDQRLNVFVNDVFAGTIQSNNIPTYDIFTSATFSVAAPALTATVSTTSASPTSTSPIPFSVSFSQSVGTSFTASDVTVSGGTLTGGSFSGSGAGPYTLTVTPTGSSTVTVSLAAGVATDANNTGNSASNSVSVQYAQPVTATPVVTVPANNSFVSTTSPTYTGTAPASSTITVYVDNTSIGTTAASTSGNWTLAQSTALSQGSHTVYATAQTSGSTVSANSNTNTFTVDSQRPSVVLSSTTVASGGTTTTSPVAFTATFSESVTGFVAGDLSVTGGTISGFSGSGTTYTFNVTPSGAGTVTVNIAANVTQDAAGNGNTAASQYSLTYQLPLVTVASVTRLTPSPTATTSVSYRVVFSGSVSGLTLSNFSLTISGLSGAAVSTLSGSNTTYTVTVNTGSGDGTLRLDVANATGVTPTISNVPYTSGEQYTITKSFAAAPALRIQAAGSASGNSDVTAFVDEVQVLSGGSTFANGLQNGSFETNNVAAGNYLYQSQGVAAAPWSFGTQAGISRNNSAFGSTASNGDAVAFLQSAAGNNGSVTQNLALPTGSYQVRFRGLQRNYTSLDQRLNVFVNDVFVGSIQPNNIPTYDIFTSATFSVTVPDLTATVSTTSASPTSTSPIPFAVSFSQSVGTTFTASDVTVTGGTLTGGSFSGSGAGPYTFTVTPSGAGTVTVSVAANLANDANNTGNTASNSVSVQYQAPTIAVAPASLPGGTQGTAYSQALSASGGSGTYTYALSGTPPPGLNLSGSTLAGTPTASGTFSFRITATDNSAAPGPYSGSRDYTVSIATQPVTAAPTVATPANGSQVGTATPTYSGTAPATSTVTVYVDGTSIGTVTATPSGVWSLAQPATLAEGSHTVRATAQAGGSTVSASSNSNTFIVDTVRPTVIISSSTGASGSATSTSPFAFTITFSESVTGFVQGDLTVTGGTISGFSGSGTTYTFSVTPSGSSSTVAVNVAANVAQDQAGNGNTAAASAYTLTFQAPTITVAPATLPGGTVGVAYSQAFTAAGGSSPYSYAISAGALPAGLTLASNGTLAGTPTASGTFTFTVTATDASAAPGPYSGSRTYSLTINAPAITVAPATLPGGTVATAYSQTITASGGTAPYAYAITAGALPAGLTLSTGGTLAGTPAAGGSFTFTVAATDAAGFIGTRGYTLTIAAPTVVVAPASLPNGATGVAYSQTITASGGTAPYSYAITAGALPAGLTLASSGTLAGRPTAGGTFTFTVTATDASTGSGPYGGSRSYSVTITTSSVAWTGAVSTDWFTAGNWSPNQVPDATIDATIPTSPSGNRFPVIASGAASARNLTLNSNATLTHTGGTLSVAANLTNNGNFRPTGGTVTLGETAQSNILGSGSTGFWNLTVGASGAQQSTSASTSVQRLLTLNGSFVTNGNPFTLASSASGTALVVNNGSNAVSGNVTVQRYIDPSLNPNLGYRHVATAVSGQQVSSLATGSFSPVVNPAYNTSATPTLVRPFPTVYGYDQSRLATTTNNLASFDKGWYSPSASADPLSVGQGYTVLIGGGQTWSFTGPLNNGDVSLKLARNSGATAGDAGLHLVGNPYPSPLDWSQLTDADRSNLDGVMYVFRSNDPSNPYTGAYGFYNNGLGTISPVLPQGQGFFVRVTPGQTLGTLTLRNSHRPTTYANPAYQRTGVETRPLVRLSLQGAGTPDADEAFVYFEAGAGSGYEPRYDAEKLANPSGLNLSTSLSATQRLSIDGRDPLGTTQLIVPLAVGVPTPGSYTLKAAQLLNLANTPTYLRDLQTGAVVDLARQASYQFTVGNASALLTSRFELVFSPQQPLATAAAALAQQVGLYPNPAKGSAFVELPASLGRQAVTATLVDAVGREVRTVSLPAQGAVAHPLDLRELPTGVYMLRLSTSAGLLVKKLTVE